MDFYQLTDEQEFMVLDQEFPTLGQNDSFNPGNAKRVVLGETGFPFGELYYEDEDSVDSIEWKQDGGSYAAISSTGYPNVVDAAKFKTFTPDRFYVETKFWLKLTAGALILERYVSMLVDVWAGVNKITRKDTQLRPFADARFCTDASLISAVSYAIDGEVSKTAIPTSYGADLITRVKEFELSWSSSGDRRITLYVTDNQAQEFSDAMIARVGVF